ncbi:enhancer of mRNA decapping, partial [Rhizopus stolonifer]
TLNRLPQKKVNLLPSENVLENKRRQRNSPVSTAKIITANGILCPSVSPLQMAHVEHECSQVSDMFAELAIESGGRGTALLALQQIRPNAKVIILAGNNKNGALGLVAARHLVNHGCLVTVCIAVAHPMHLSNAVARYESLATQCGVSVCYSSNQLQDADMVIDALLGIDDKLVDISDRPTYDIVCQSIDWANQQSRPILAVDFPSGMDASTGIPHHPEHKICPTWTLCLNAPKTGCKSLKTTGELYLVDTGIPRLCWKRVGIKGNTIPWGADFLVALQYNE